MPRFSVTGAGNGPQRCWPEFARKATDIAEVRPAGINGLPGFLILAADGIDGVWALETRDEKIAAVYISRNPDKLGAVARVTGLPIG